LNKEDEENCHPHFWRYSLGFILPMLIATVCTGEMFLLLSTKRARKPEEHQLIANELNLFPLLKESIQKESEPNLNIINKELSNKFVEIHNRDNYTFEMNTVANLLFNTDEIRSKDYANLFYKLEHQFHKKDTREMHICIKTHLGTGKTSEHFFAIIESPNWFSRILYKQLKNLTHKFKNNLTLSKPALGLWFVINALFNAIVYHLDFVKDVFMVVCMKKFIHFSISTFQSFEVQFFFLFCLSIIVSIFSNSILISFNTNIAILRSWKIRIIFATMSILSPSVAQYIVQQLHLKEKPMDKTHFDTSSTDILQTMQEINHIMSEKRLKLIKHNLLV